MTISAVIQAIFLNIVLPWLQKKYALVQSGAWSLNPLDLLKSGRVAAVAAGSFAVVNWLDRIIPDGLLTLGAVAVVAALIDTLSYRLVKGEVQG